MLSLLRSQSCSRANITRPQAAPMRPVSLWRGQLTTTPHTLCVSMISLNRSRHSRSMAPAMFFLLRILFVPLLLFPSPSNRSGSSSRQGIPSDGWDATAIPTRFLWKLTARTVLLKAFFQSRIDATFEGLLSLLPSRGCILFVSRVVFVCEIKNKTETTKRCFSRSTIAIVWIYVCVLSTFTVPKYCGVGRISLEPLKMQ
mmetsp:Transcript_21540/g.48431  ORF Transcript_21540/g.48431 Transcript_21540/m.48431 type:complete len:200 (-) Transcript_21540:123-722(-)